MKLINARINNLESNLHIEIDMERIEDKSKALSYIGIEVADALKLIPAPVDNEVENVVEEEKQEYVEETTFEAKPTLWERIKKTKLGRAVSYVLKIRIRVELPNALPEGRGE
jgi:S-adenosylmethionine:diacylglycerol 3-amino-3-carboxypropyl transferase